MTATQQTPDEMDQLLRAFFRAEVPQPWPAVNPPAASASRGRALVRSRLALAASVVILLLGSLFLSGSLRDRLTPRGVGTDSSVAKDPFGFSKQGAGGERAKVR